MLTRNIALALIVALVPLNASAGFGSFLKKLMTDERGPSDTKIASGLKEALRIGAEKAVSLTGKKDGYFKNDKIKIPLPETVGKIEKTLRMVGFGPQIDNFVLSMNRAAEKAAPAAKKIFVDAISQMTFEDVRKIWKGGDTAATDYFKEKTTKPLTKAFRPVVEKAMSEQKVVSKYKGIVGKYEKIPFIKEYAMPDIEGYTVQKALDGLFHVLGEQERLIRKDPAARVTRLLKEVFAERQ